MTLSAVKKLVLKLPPKQRIELADVLYDSVPVMPGSVGLVELEHRAEEVISGKVKSISWEVFQRDLDKMRKSIKGDRAIADRNRDRKTPKSKVGRSA